MPQASSPAPGLDDADAALREHLKVGLGGRVLPHVDVHGGGDKNGRGVARYMVVRKSSAMPWANLARMLAVAGATTRASVHCASAMCSMPFWSAGASADSHWSQRLVRTLWPVSAAKVSGWTNLHGGRGHDDVHFKGLALQRAHQLSRFIGGDSAGDADGDSHGSIVEQ